MVERDKFHEHRIKLLLNEAEFSQFFKYHSEGRLQGSSVDLETDLECYFEGVVEADLRNCFGAAADELCQGFSSLPHKNNGAVLFDLVLRAAGAVY